MEMKWDKFDESSFNLFKKPKNETVYQYDDIQLTFPKFEVKSKFNAVEVMKK